MADFLSRLDIRLLIDWMNKQKTIGDRLFLQVSQDGSGSIYRYNQDKYIDFPELLYRFNTTDELLAIINK